MKPSLSALLVAWGLIAFGVVLLVLFLTGCATTTRPVAPAWAHLGPPPYSITPTLDVVFVTRAEAARLCPPPAPSKVAAACLLTIHSLTGASLRQHMILGLDTPAEAAIAATVVHEMKHVLDPAWSHP